MTPDPLTSPSEQTYIHGTDPSEQARLALLNRLTNQPFVEFLQLRLGMRVLEVGSGLGLLAAEVSHAADGIEVVGLERSAEQIAAAAASPNVRYVQGDAHKLPFDDASFDLVYCRYLLEHVVNPARVLAEMRRVARPGSRVAAMENDISLVRLDPPCPAFDEVWVALAAFQKQLGGDAHIGRRLFALFRAAGFANIELSLQPEVHWQGSPGFAGWVENLLGNLRSAEKEIAVAGLCSQELLERAKQELRAVANHRDGSMIFAWNRAIAVR